MIKGVGPVTAKRIVAHFGADTLDIIEQQINLNRLIEVPGIAKKRVKRYLMWMCIGFQPAASSPHTGTTTFAICC
ncbi:helix-hairpin-helix domain-containing protein [Microcoleus sp. FACHB-1515]|uniref:helix-hairpin-helix domain-containing protein n=1 Tax=Microcoleus sp. FACHB-1515 TaxID=2692821 RepID=UPI001F5546F8|nr:helix-hairpin-helix domain-containing protein [Microcoleus sp. FACHB-1515]